jgi:hypothetical protein
LIRDVIKRKKIVAMKSFDRLRLRLVGVCVALLGIAPVAALTCAAAPSGTVTIKDDVILIHPGTKLTEADREQLNEVLSSYDKSLFKVQTYKSGKLTRTIGELSDVLLDQALVSEVATAAAKGNSSRTLQVIAATMSQRLGSATSPQSTAAATTNPQRTSDSATNPQRGASATTNPSPSPGVTTNPQQNARATGEKAARELIERLKPILEKYSKH